jgi:tyrosine-protein phosphatase OCA1
LDFIDDQEIQLHHLGVVSSVNAWDPITEEAVLQALDLTLNPTSYPMMIMCNLGRHRTGKRKEREKINMATNCEYFFRNNCWMHEKITALEFNIYAGPKVRLLNEQFIELFDTDLVGIPTNKPKWM